MPQAPAIAFSIADSAASALAPSGPPACAMSGRPPPPLPPSTSEPLRTSSTALKREVRSAVTPTTMPALPSSVTPTMATTPEPICFLPSSTRLFRSLVSTPSTARARRFTLPISRMPPGQRLDAAHARSDRALADDGDQADVAGAPHVGAAAKLDRPAECVAALLARALAHRDDADLIAILLAEQGAGASLARLVHRHQARGDLVILQHHLVGDVLNTRKLFRTDRLRMHEVEAQPVRRHQRAALGDMVAEHQAQRLVQQVRRRVMGADRAAPVMVDLELQRGARLQRALLHRAGVDEEV